MLRITIIKETKSHLTEVSVNCNAGNGGGVMRNWRPRGWTRREQLREATCHVSPCTGTREVEKQRSREREACTISMSGAHVGEAREKTYVTFMTLVFVLRVYL